MTVDENGVGVEDSHPEKPHDPVSHVASMQEREDCYCIGAPTEDGIHAVCSLDSCPRIVTSMAQTNSFNG